MNKMLAVIGCGYWGKNLVRVFSELGVLHTVCDANRERFDSLQFTEERPEFAASLDKVLANEAIKAVAIATPASTHASIVEKCLEANKDVFVEKPLALTSADGEKLVALAHSKSRILMVGHILLYHPAVAKLKEMIDAGELGRILYCYSNRLNMGLIRTEENILWSFAPHDISVMLHLLGEEPTECHAEGQSYLTQGVVDVTLSRLQFPSGATGHIFVSWLHPVKEQKLVVVGSERMAVFDDTSANKLVVYPHKVEWRSRIPTAIKAAATTIEIESYEPLKEECRHYLECVANRHEPRTHGAEGLRVLRVLDACQQSMQSIQKQSNIKVSPHNSDYQAHESTFIDQPCSIGAGTRIWHYSHVMKGASIGSDCSLGQNVVVASTAVIGNGVKIQNNVSIYDGVTLEDFVFCGPSTVFTNVMNPRSEVVRKHEYKPTVVRRGASLGANSTVVCGTEIGEYAFVAAGAVVNRKVPAFAIVAGVPAKQIGWMCRCGHRLVIDDIGESTCFECGDSYQLNESILNRTSMAARSTYERPN